MSDKSDTYPQQSVPAQVDEQTFRVEMMRGMRHLTAKVEGIDARLHQGDLKLQEHAADLEQQASTHQAEINRLRDDNKLKEQQITELRQEVKSLQGEQQTQGTNLTVLSTRFAVVWALLGGLGMASITALVASLTLLLRAHP